MKRIARILIDINSLTGFLRGLNDPYLVQASGIPDDIRVVGMVLDRGVFNRLILFVESESFDEVREGEDVPTITPTLTQKFVTVGFPEK